MFFIFEMSSRTTWTVCPFSPGDASCWSRLLGGVRGSKVGYSFFHQKYQHGCSLSALFRSEHCHIESPDALQQCNDSCSAPHIQTKYHRRNCITDQRSVEGVISPNTHSGGHWANILPSAVLFSFFLILPVDLIIKHSGLILADPVPRYECVHMHMHIQ